MFKSTKSLFFLVFTRAEIEPQYVCREGAAHILKENIGEGCPEAKHPKFFNHVPSFEKNI